MRKGITDIALLQRIIQLLASSIGSPISAKKISDTLNASGRRISVNTVDTYLLLGSVKLLSPLVGRFVST